MVKKHMNNRAKDEKNFESILQLNAGHDECQSILTLDMRGHKLGAC